MEIVKTSSINCLKCTKTFSSGSNLKKHVKKFHANQINELAPGIYKNSSLYKYTCNYCQKNFNDKCNFVTHTNKHISLPQESSGSSIKMKCPMCNNYSCDSKNAILVHFNNVHDIAINLEEHIFSSFKEFEEWKSNKENETLSKFCIKKTKKHKKGTTIKYICHRSGYYVPNGDGKRHLKTQGSCKIGGYCPASITVYQNDQNSLKVNFITSHVGHENEIGHLTLAPLERKMLASKIASKIPYDEILNEVRDSISDDTLKRIHLLNRQDLYNIETSFNLTSSSVRHQNDAISVEAWVNQMRQEGDTILFYKAQGVVLQEQPELKSEDFVLIIMTTAQQKFLEKYGTDCICVDGTHGLNGYAFEMTTLMVLDDLREGFPAAFLISNRCDKDVMLIFFSNIQLKVGVIKTSVFMSDLAESYFNAWIEIMGPPEKRLYCTWHLLRAWRNNLSKIKGKEKQDVIYKQLRALLEERDQVAFEIMIENFCIFTDSDFEDFKKYFRDNYFNNRQYWAYCYRLNCGINTNMHLERMHGLIKYIYLKGKKVKRLDKAIHAIMRMVRDKLIDRLIVTNKGKVSKKLQDIRQRHKTSLSLDQSLIVKVEHGWEMPSRSRNEVYFLQEYRTICSCKLVCTECATCIHKYRCSCLDSSIKFNMCKHSHLVAQFRQKTEDQNKEISGAASYDSVADENELYMVTKSDNEDDIILKQIGTKTSSVAIDDQKNNVRRKIERHLQKITSEKQMESLNKLLAPISPVMAAIEEERNYTHPRPSLTEPPNKKISVQRRLFSTKKKKNANIKKYKKPTPTELDRISLDLLYPK